MRKVLRINSEGFYIEDVILQDNESMPSDCIETQCQDGLYKPKWNGNEWVEGLTQIEIDSIKNEIQPKTELEILKLNQSLIQKALDDLILGGGL